MMTSKCYLCEKGHKTIPGERATDALGVCENCSILACKAHAVRDSSYPRWICVLCDTSLLASAGIATSANKTLNNIFTALVSSALLKQGARYKSLEVFLENRPQYDWILNSIDEVVQKARSKFTTDVTEPFWFGLSDEGRRLIAAAIIVVEKLELHEDDLIEALRILIHDWRREE